MAKPTQKEIDDVADIAEKRIQANECLRPRPSLLVKLGSIAVHVEEMLSPKGHAYDKIAIEQLLRDSEVREWIEQMDKMAMLPVKR